MTTDTLEPLVPAMHAETGYDESDSAPPLRVSGFIALLLGLLSITSVLAKPLLLIPLAAILVGFFALRRGGGPTAIGIRPAKIGLVLAFGFGACGFFLPWFRVTMLGSQAKQFARNYMEVVANGEDLYALELQKDYVNRFPPSMNLQEHYAISEGAKEALREFQRSAANQTVQDRGPNAVWELYEPIQVYYSYGYQHAVMKWHDPTGETDAKIRMELEYRVDSEGNGQWRVESMAPVTPRYTAPSIL